LGKVSQNNTFEKSITKIILLGKVSQNNTFEKSITKTIRYFMEYAWVGFGATFFKGCFGATFLKGCFGATFLKGCYFRFGP
jgi:hypothetical protein